VNNLKRRTAMPHSPPVASHAAKPCPCGLGENRRDLVDMRGIFCAFVCDACEVEKRAEFRPQIFTGPYPNDEPLDDD
jgi:hypothetical protein